MTRLTALSWNFENNGKQDPARRQAGGKTLASLAPDILFRQEMSDAGAHGKQILAETEKVLGMRGWLGQPHKPGTGLFVNPRRFAPVRDWCATPGPMWVIPPTALTMRYLPAGHDALPLVLISYHLNYASPTTRLAEAEWLTTWADKGWRRPDGTTVTLPAAMAGDNNSYPAEPLTDAEPPLPELARITNLPHRLHRSVPQPDGARVVDTRPDAALRTAGLEDAARFWATTRRGDKTAAARTVTARATHGPDSRIDRAYLTPELLPALTGVDVIEVEYDMSDHHILRFTLDPDTLADILNEQPARTA